MELNNGTPTDAFAEYLQTKVRLDALEQMTKTLDDELADSQRIMREIKTIFNSIPTVENAEYTSEQIGGTNLEINIPKLLLPDMVQATTDIDLDNIIATMKVYTEELKKNIIIVQPSRSQVPKDINKEKLDFEQYACSMDQLGKKLANLKLSKKTEMANRNDELESKLAQLCENVNNFTQLIQSRTLLSNSAENWSLIPNLDVSLQYDTFANNLLSTLNEVSYLLQNKH